MGAAWARRSQSSLLSIAALSLAATRDIVIASVLGSVTAALACEHRGNRQITPEEVEEKLYRIEKRAHFE